MKTIGVAVATLALLLVGATAVVAQEDEAMTTGEPAVYFTGTFESLPPELPDPVMNPKTGVGRMWGTGHIENDEGAWDGVVRGLHYPAADGVDGYTAFGVLTGSGAYEGQTYSYRASFDGEDALVEAIIYEGEPTPVE